MFVVRLWLSSFRHGVSTLTRTLFNRKNEVAGFSLGFVTAFFVRDERDFPTYMRIKRAYLEHCDRLAAVPKQEVLMIIDPMLYYREFSQVSVKLAQDQKSYDQSI